MGCKTSTTPVAKSSVDTMSKTDQSISADSCGSTSADTDKIMAAISSCQTALMSKIDDLQADINRLRYDMDKMKDRTSEVGRRVGVVEGPTHTNENANNALQQQMKTLQAHAEDAENHNRRNNVRILCLPERAEGTRPGLFIEQLIQDCLSPIELFPCFIVEPANRIPTLALPPGAPPCPFIIKILNYRDRDAIIAAARRKGKLTYENAKLSFYPDFG